MANEEFWQDDDTQLWCESETVRNALREHAATAAAYVPVEGASTPAPGKAEGTGQAARYNHGKVELSYVPVEQMASSARALMYGAKKYKRDNFRHGFAMYSVVDSLLRHVFAYLGGEDVDPESGLHHVDHINANAGFLAVGVEAEWPRIITKETTNGSK